MKNIVKLLLAFTLITTYSCTAQTEIKPFAKNISVDEVEKLLVDGIQLVDVRTDKEIAQGYIENAMTFNVMDPGFMKNIQKLDKNKPVILYCRSGNRSGKALKMLQTDGFKYVYNMLGGIKAWNGAKKALVKK